MRLAQQGRIGFTSALLLAQISVATALAAQAPARLISTAVDASRVQVLAHHHPLWANPANDLGPLPPAQQIESLTLVLNRPAAQQAAFEQFLAGQQNPASPDYHHWLTPSEVGQRFGPSNADIATLTGWLQSQGLHVNWVAPSKAFIGFGGAAADVSRAFGTSLHLYRVNGVQRMSVASNPTIPAAVAPAIRAVQGLYSIAEQPQHLASTKRMDAPDLTTTSGAHFISPGDFAAIYDLPNGLTGAGQTIGIVGRARVDSADLDNFKSVLGVNFANPTVVVPTAFGGADPGPAYTSPPPSNVSVADQGEATLDVLRAASTAPGANLLLVVATADSGGIEADAQYLVNTTPVPAHVLNISFGDCELDAGPSGVSFWNTLFQQAAAEGISTFVSSGDSGAAGCDDGFTTPPAVTQADSPNYICASPYATCVGGTQFNDPNSNLYWGGNAGLLGPTATGYIPEGGWNESWNGSTAIVAATGGGVSQYVATPAWQKGVAGVPAAGTGRYTPDLSFSAAQHDGYFACFAAGGGNCVSTATGLTFTIFSGTSAAAPAMAAVAALLDQSLGGPQGNLNPGIYQMSRSAPTAFHDVTLTSSGVSSCSASLPSMCNNSIAGPSGLSGVQAGYLVGDGYDEVTGLGSLDAAKLVAAWDTATSIFTPTVSVSSRTAPVNQDIWIGINVTGGPYSNVPTGSVVLTAGSYTSAATPLLNGFVYVVIPAGKLAMATYPVSVSYTPDPASATLYNAASGAAQLTVSAPQYIQPAIVLSPSPTVITSTQAVTLAVSLRGASGNPAPTGTVSAVSGSYASGPLPLTPASGSVSDAEAVLLIPAGALPPGNDAVTVTYTPDAAATTLYLGVAASTLITNQGGLITPLIGVAAASLQTTTAQPLAVPVSVSGYSGNPPPTGTVVVSTTGYSSPATVLAGGTAIVNIPVGALPAGYDPLTVRYTPDAQSASSYASASTHATAAVSLAQKILPALAVNPVTANPTPVQPLVFSIVVSGGGGNPTPAGSVQVGESGFAPVAAALSNGAATVTLPPGAFSGGVSQFTITYSPGADSPLYYDAASVPVAVSVSKATPALSVTAGASTITTLQAAALNVTLSGGATGPLPTGNLQVSSSGYSATIAVQYGGTAISIPAGDLPPGQNTVTVTYSGDANYAAATAKAAVAVTLPANAGFGIQAGSLSVTKGATSGNASLVTVTPVNGFTGTVTLTAAIVSRPAGAHNLPGLTFTPSALNVAGSQPATAKLIVQTASASSTAQLVKPATGGWKPAGGAALACLLFCLVPVRRRRWSQLLGMAVLLAVALAGVSACSGSLNGANGANSGSSANSGTSSGQYTIAITATSGSLTASNTITVTVQ